MPSINLPTGMVHYQEYGQGAPLVLLHANPGDSRDFDAVIPELSKNYRVMALDWPGYGQSVMPINPEQIDVPFYYQVFQAFVERLELSGVIIIGNSVGGLVAARYASENPDKVRALVLVSPGGFTPHNALTRLFCKIQGSVLSLSPYRFASLYLKHRTATARQMLQRASSVHKSPERLKLNRALWRSFARPESDLRTLATNITAPALLLFGKHDPAIPAGKDGLVAANVISHASFIVLPCGHASFAEMPERFLQETEGFLAGC
ncbi:MAG: alpha/beta hydrolase [Hahellaceae bacterium]|nr:alpha/beta hydrolase [Hahellaceae bacterium]